MGGYDRQEEEAAVEDDIGVEPCEEHDCDGREDYVEDRNDGPFDDHDASVGFGRLDEMGVADRRYWSL